MLRCNLILRHASFGASDQVAVASCLAAPLFGSISPRSAASMARRPAELPYRMDGNQGRTDDPDDGAHAARISNDERREPGKETLQDKDRDVDLSPEEGRQVRRLASADSYVVHEVIRRQGHAELRRPALSLFWSGIAAGIAISSSVLGEALLESVLPDASWRPVVAAAGYSVGFLIVIMGRMQLFTESTLLATIPVATSPTLSNLLRLLRLWGIVFGANMLGHVVHHAADRQSSDRL